MEESEDDPLAGDTLLEAARCRHKRSDIQCRAASHVADVGLAKVKKYNNVRTGGAGVRWAY